jgi:hypothetical protein
MNLYDFYNEELSNKKTVASKKGFLTKSLNQCNEHLKDLLEHKNPKGNINFGYLHGEPVTALRIVNCKTEIKVIENLKKTL